MPFTSVCETALLLCNKTTHSVGYCYRRLHRRDSRPPSFRKCCRRAAIFVELNRGGADMTKRDAAVRIGSANKRENMYRSLRKENTDWRFITRFDEDDSLGGVTIYVGCTGRNDAESRVTAGDVDNRTLFIYSVQKVRSAGTPAACMGHAFPKDLHTFWTP